jgi:hypothetical protein
MLSACSQVEKGESQTRFRFRYTKLSECFVRLDRYPEKKNRRSSKDFNFSKSIQDPQTDQKQNVQHEGLLRRHLP